VLSVPMGEMCLFYLAGTKDWRVRTASVSGPGRDHKMIRRDDTAEIVNYNSRMRVVSRQLLR